MKRPVYVSTRGFLPRIPQFIVLLLLCCADSHTQSAGEQSTDTQRSDSVRQTMTTMIEEHKQRGEHPNRLINERSPYLLQHAFNPVDWYPWGEEAFTKARDEDKPIFLSVGYSTCYWCHVMEREVFENAEIAELMNDNLVSIKVDREERPDIDRLYMTAVQALTGSGGWPMSVFLTPDLKPFFGGTYFPPVPRQGQVSFPQIIEKISEIWRNDKRSLRQSGDQVLEHIATYSGFTAADVHADSAAERAYEEFAASFDTTYGGFGGAPKFPRPSSFAFLFSRYARTKDHRAITMALTTLRAMSRGGVYDHIGGGFHRYSVDEQWRVPHFEKMLYDQAQLATAYLTAFQISADSGFAVTARDILAYVQRGMTDPTGGFYSAEDAESASDPSSPEAREEGSFYVWTLGEIARYTGEADAQLFCNHFGVRPEGNALADPLGVFEGKNILYAAQSVDESARQSGLTSDEVSRRLQACRSKLFSARELRPKPFRDEKIISAWNGLMISAFARGYQVLGDASYLVSARNAASFVLTHLRSQDGKLMRRFRDGEARFTASLQDYAFVIQALLDLYETDFDIRWIDEAIVLLRKQIELFGNQHDGGFFDTPSGESDLLLRTREDYDGAEPTGNSISALNLYRLGRMTNSTEWISASSGTIRAFGARLDNRPDMLPQMLVACDAHSAAPREIVVAGRPGSPEMQDLLRMIHARYLPHTTILVADGSAAQERLSTFLPSVRDMRMLDGRPTVYFCENYACQLPTNDVSLITRRLDAFAVTVR